MRAMSAKRRRENRLRRKMADALGPTRCALRTPVCTGRAECFHELVAAAHNGSRIDPRNIAPAAAACNGWVENNITVAIENLWKVPSWASVPGDGGFIPAEPNPYALASLSDVMLK